MNEINETKNILQNISDYIHTWVQNHIVGSFSLFMQISLKVLLLLVIFLIIDTFFKLVFKLIYRPIRSKNDKPFIKAVFTGKITNSISNFLSVAIVREMIAAVFYRHPKSHDFLQTTFRLMFVVVLALLYFRILKAIENYYTYKGIGYKLTGITAVTQSLRIIGFLVFGIIGISIFLHVETATIVGSLGAATALILLFFRDTILGFVAGIHVSSSRNIKVGDWVAIPKYQMEGYIEEINLMTTKVRNFDKTLSTIPTYDLVATEVRNQQVMWEGNRRRIKKSIIFNIKSFRFLTSEDLERLRKVAIIKNYIEEKKTSIKEALSTEQLTDEDILNHQQLTNIGLFRIYTHHYLKNNPNIDQEDIVLVRQLEITPQGLPLEIYCFANESDLEKYERIQSDIFDHLMVVSQYFGLEVMQTVFKS